MNLERGFRRIVRVVSLALFFSALGATIYITYRATLFLSAEDIYRNCVRQAGYDLWMPHLMGEELKRMIEAGQRQGVFEKCSATANFPEEPPPNVLYVVWGPAWRDWPIGKFVLITGGLGVILSVGAATIAWGMFYLSRWIVRGFRAEF